jgi:hypothetical protein
MDEGMFLDRYELYMGKVNDMESRRYTTREDGNTCISEGIMYISNRIGLDR